MATMREVEKMIRSVRECDNMIRYIMDTETHDTFMPAMRGTTQGTRDAMVGGLLQRKNNLLEALAKLGIIDEVA